jgi:2-dehydro-3-deoxyphosphogluconate aldolase/(4S)-4-hydroxy-2-oxoglutarate aldolase
MTDPIAFTRLRDQRLIAVIRAPDTAVALEAARAVVRGGITMIEITYTVPDPARVISELARNPAVTVGAGTVLTASQASEAIVAGAHFIVAPNLSAEVARVALESEVMYCPGAFTTGEILAARAAGAHIVKVYPVGVVGGPAYIKVIREPLPRVPMLAAGGTTLDNAAAFLEAGCIALGLGASLADPVLARAGRYDEIASRAAAFVRKVADWRTV